jgi:hypothetical protein
MAGLGLDAMMLNAVMLVASRCQALLDENTHLPFRDGIAIASLLITLLNERSISFIDPSFL